MATDQALADEIVDTIRTWVDREVMPNAAEFEHSDTFPQAMFDQMCDFGLFGATIPEEYGGLGLDIPTYARIIEELSRGFMSLAGILNTHKIGATMIGRFGTEEQRQRFLPRMCDGSFRAAFSLSEPDAGSDTGAIRCRAERDGDEWVVNGTKFWVTNGQRSSLVMLMARTPDDRITCFLVEKEPGGSFEGITVSKNIEKLGYKGLETVEMSYVDHRVPHANVLGGDDGMGHGRQYALSALELGRINVAARSVGVAQAAFDAAMRYAQQRETFGRPIYEHQAIQFKLADMATKLQAARRATGRHGGRHGQAVRLRGGVRDRHRGVTHPRRQRLHHRVPGGALLSRHPANDHRRGNERDPENGYRQKAARALSRRVSTGVHRSEAEQKERERP